MCVQRNTVMCLRTHICNGVVGIHVSLNNIKVLTVAIEIQWFLSALLWSYKILRNAFNNIQSVTGGTDQTSGVCFLGQTIPI